MIALEIGINCIFGFGGPWLWPQHLDMVALGYGGPSYSQFQASDQSPSSPGN